MGRTEPLVGSILKMENQRTCLKLIGMLQNSGRIPDLMLLGDSNGQQTAEMHAELTGLNL